MPKPQQPDPYDLARAQTGLNTDTAIASQFLNNPNQQTPLGSSSYNQSGTATYIDSFGNEVQIPTFTNTVELAPEQQALLEQQTALARQLGNYASRATSQLGNLPVVGDYSADRQQVTDTILERMQPYFEQDEAAARQRLASYGHTPGSEPYRNDLFELGRQKNDARLGAVLAGGQEQSRLAGLNLAQRGQLAGEIGLAAGAVQPTFPQFGPQYQQGVNSAPYDQYVYQNYQDDVQRRQARMEGLFGLGGTIAKGLFGLGVG